MSSALLDLAPLVVYRHPDQLPGRRRFFLLRRVQAQVFEDARDGRLVRAQLGGQRLFIGAASAGSSEPSESLVHLDAAFKGHRVVAIGEDRIVGYIRNRLAEKAANATVNRELAALKRMLRLGQRARKVGRLPYVAMQEERNRRTGFFDPEQFRAVLEGRVRHGLACSGRAGAAQVGQRGLQQRAHPY